MQQVAIITGGGRGIGKALALRLSKDFAIIIVGRTQANLEVVCAEISAHGGTAYFVVGDVKNPETAQRAVALAQEKGLTVRTLVCNAGIGKSGPFETFDPEMWREIFAVNVDGAFHFCQAVLPQMKLSGGTICLMSSIAGLKGYAYNAAYDASKHALVGLARSLAQEYGKHGISVVPVCPGFVEGEMTERTLAGVMHRHGISREDAIVRITRANPQRRIIPVAEVAEAVAFACSGQASSLSGNPLVLTGGE